MDFKREDFARFAGICELRKSTGSRWAEQFLTSFETIKWMSEADCDSLNEWMLYNAAEKGRIDIVKQLSRSGCRVRSAVMLAAQGGHLEILQRFVDGGFVLDANVMTNAAVGNQLETMKWLHEHDCPRNHIPMRIAHNRGYQAMIKWLEETA